MTDLSGKVALVTGAAQGLGRTIAERLAGRGARLIIADVQQDKAEDVAAACGNDSLALLCDVSEEGNVAALYADIEHVTGRLDILVNNAGMERLIAWDDVDLARWQRVIDVDLTGTFLMCRGASDIMRRQGVPGRIINICSSAAFAGPPNMAAHVAATCGVLGLTRALATEFARFGITVNAVSPAIPMLARDPAAQADGGAGPFVSPNGRPEDVAPAVVFLASDEAGSITGQTLNVGSLHVDY